MAALASVGRGNARELWSQEASAGRAGFFVT